MSQALGLAIQLGDVQLCERLIEEGADLNLGMKDCLGCTPVLYALHHGRPAIAERLIKRGASISGATCENRKTQGFTALHYAARGGYTELLQLLLARSTKSDVFHLQSPVHPIHLAVASGNIRCLELLLDPGDGPGDDGPGGGGPDGHRLRPLPAGGQPGELASSGPGS